MSEYADELIRRITAFSARYKKRPADTVYFGGGTPTLMPAECFEGILTALKNNFDISKDTEITGGFGRIVVNGNLAAVEDGGFVGIILDLVNTCVEEKLRPVSLV